MTLEQDTWNITMWNKNIAAPSIECNQQLYYTDENEPSGQSTLNPPSLKPDKPSGR